MIVRPGSVMRGIWQRPLNSSSLIDHLVIANARNVTRLTTRQLFHDLENRFWGRPFFEHFSAAPILGDQFEDIEVRQGLAWRSGDFFDQPDPSLGVNEGPH